MNTAARPKRIAHEELEGIAEIFGISSKTTPDDDELENIDTYTVAFSENVEVPDDEQLERKLRDKIKDLRVRLKGGAKVEDRQYSLELKDDGTTLVLINWKLAALALLTSQYGREKAEEKIHEAVKKHFSKEIKKIEKHGGGHIFSDRKTILFRTDKESQESFRNELRENRAKLREAEKKWKPERDEIKAELKAGRTVPPNSPYIAKLSKDGKLIFRKKAKKAAKKK
jgi:hypothetical protein